MTRRTRSDTAAGQTKAMQGAMARIDPPAWVTVPDDARPFWDSITRARAVDRWSEPDLEMAAELARVKLAIEEENITLETEGRVVRNERGTPVENPRNRALETLRRSAIALSRALHVHAEATSGRAADERKANAQQDKARRTTKGVGGDGLIATPKH